MNVEERQAIEKRIVTSAIKELQENGYQLRADNGEEVLHSGNVDELVEHLFATDEASLQAFTENGTYTGIVEFVFGNDGWDVISDYHLCLEPYLTKTFAFIEEIFP